METLVNHQTNHKSQITRQKRKTTATITKTGSIFFTPEVIDKSQGMNLLNDVIDLAKTRLLVTNVAESLTLISISFQWSMILVRVKYYHAVYEF